MNRKRLEYIDFAKGFAILSIVIFHYCQPFASGLWSRVVMLGGTGGHLFFILSGFGLGLSAQKNMDLLYYFKKRFIKILIPYYIVILIIYAVNTIFPIYRNDGLYALLGNLFLYKMFDEKIIGSFGYHFWFISAIVQFYLAFPLIVRLKKRISLPIFVAGSFLISFVWYTFTIAYDITDKTVFSSFFLQYLWEFNIGVVLADLYVSRNLKVWEVNPAILLLLSILGITSMGLMAVNGGRVGQTINDIPASIGYFSLSILIYSTSNKCIRILKNAILYIGKISYELYLTHMFFLLILNRLLLKIIKVDPNIFFAVLIALPLSISMSYMLTSFNKKFYTKIHV